MVLVAEVAEVAAAVASTALDLDSQGVLGTAVDWVWYVQMAG